MKLILQTRRLTLRELEKEDVGALRLILQDPYGYDVTINH